MGGWRQMGDAYGRRFFFINPRRHRKFSTSIRSVLPRNFRRDTELPLTVLGYKKVWSAGPESILTPRIDTGIGL